MVGLPPKARFARAVIGANRLLARHGYTYRGDAAALRAWLRTDTPYPNPSPAELLDAPFLVVHEIVEIAEVRRMGLGLTKDVIVKHMDRINDAHLRAAEVEFDIALREGRRAYARSRFRDLVGWCRDPLLTAAQRAAYEAFRQRIDEMMRAAAPRRGHRPTGEL